MAIYFLRHGESQANLKGVFAGQKDDTPLTEVGLVQAKQAANELKGLGIDRIIASKLKRSYQTALEVAKVIRFDPNKIETDDRILEYDMGVLTGTPIRTITSQELTSGDGAENVTVFRDRVLSFLHEHQHSPQTILMVSHAGVGRAIEAVRQGVDPREFYGLPPYPNGHAVKLDLDWLT